MNTKTITLVLALAVIFTGSLFANEPVVAPKEVSSSLLDIIENEMDYPEFAIEERIEDVVIMELRIQKDGSLEVIDVNATYDNMRKHAVETVENIETTDFAEYAGQTVLVKVKYDLLLH